MTYDYAHRQTTPAKRGRPPKVSPDAAHRIRRAHADGMTYAELAARFGVHAHTIKRVVQKGEGK